MKVDAQPEWRNHLSRQATSSLTMNDKRNEEGSDEVLMNPALEDKPDERIFDEIEEILSSVHLTDGLRRIEDENRSKFGPRSIAIPWEERRESLLAYFKHADVDVDSFPAEDSPAKVNRARVLRPISVEQASQRLIPRSSSGLPYMTRKRNVLDHAVANFHHHEGVWPCVLYTRTQEQKKTRNVWGYPISDTLAEARFFTPWLKVEKEFHHRAALLGPSAVDQAVTRMFAERRNDEIFKTVDFSAYDATVSPEMSMRAFGYISRFFQKEFETELFDEWVRFVTIPIWTPDGEWSGVHGVPSGSMYTNTIDSLVQWLAIRKFGIDGDMFQIQGDDGMYIIPESMSDDFENAFGDIGLNLNQDKSYESKDDGTFLQRYYHPEYHYNGAQRGLGGVYSLYRAALRIKYLERWTNFHQEGIEGSDFFSLRTVMILENCKHHPGFEKFVRSVQSWDKYGLRFTSKGLSAYSKMEESKTRAGLFGAVDSLEGGIKSFETLKILAK